MSKEDDKYLGKVGGGQFTEDKEENVEATTTKLTERIQKKQVKLNRKDIKYLMEELLMDESDAKNLLVSHKGSLDAAVDYYVLN